MYNAITIVIRPSCILCIWYADDMIYITDLVIGTIHIRLISIQVSILKEDSMHLHVSWHAWWVLRVRQKQRRHAGAVETRMGLSSPPEDNSCHCGPWQLQGKKTKKGGDNFPSKNTVKCTRMWEIASTCSEILQGRTFTPPPLYAHPHTQNAADALDVAPSLNTHASSVNPG